MECVIYLYIFLVSHSLIGKERGEPKPSDVADVIGIWLTGVNYFALETCLNHIRR